MKPSSYLIALVGGLCSVFLIHASSRLGAAGVPLLMAGPLPIYFVALAYGTGAGAIASVIAIVGSAFFASPQSAMVIGLMFTIPASVIGHQANLADVSQDGSVTKWYPLEYLLFNMALVVAIGLIASGYVAGYDPSELSSVMTEAMREMIANPQTGAPASEADVQLVVARTLALLPFLFAGAWLAVHALNLQVASQFARLANRMPRPKDDIPASANLPISALIILAVSLVLAAALSGPLQLAASALAGTLFMALAMVGLAALHHRLRHSSSATPLLVIVYLLIILFYFPLFLFAVVGISRAAKRKSNLPPANPPASD